MSNSTQTARRDFLRKLMAGTTAALTLPAFASGEGLPPVEAPADAGDERYWESIKRQFAVPGNLVMMNAANLCPAPFSVSQAVQQTLNDLGKDVSFHFRDKFDEIRVVSLDKLASYLGVTKEEISITRNTSEGNNIIVNGFDLKAGDEVVLWDQNHPSNNVAWEFRAKRLGFTVKKVTVPANPKTADDLIQPFQKAITAKTKFLGFSHISNVSGIALPAKELCKMASSRGVLTLVDGAQSFGFVDINLRDLGCDFYTGSTHKWLMGPLENGVLFVKKESMVHLWPQIISAGWNEKGTTADARLAILGQRNEATPAALPEALDFHQAIGKPVVEARVRALNSYLRDQLKDKLNGVTFITPLDPGLNGGITVFTVPGKTHQEIYDKIYKNHGIAGAATLGVRLSPNIYNTKADIDRAVDAVRTVVNS